MQVQQQQQISQVQSLHLVQNIIRSTIGSVAYVRNLFPDDSFETKTLDNVAVKVIKRDLSIEGNTLLDWIEKGCFDALEKQYLATLVFGIYLDPKNPTDLAECYYFHFSYPTATSYSINISTEEEDDGGPTKQEISKSTTQLVRRLLLMTQNLDPLPENAYITIRLFYNHNTPMEYEPPGFKMATDDLPDSFGRDLDIGSVATRHHTMTCQVLTKSGEVTAQEDSTQNLISKLKVHNEVNSGQQLPEIAEYPEPSDVEQPGKSSSEAHEQQDGVVLAPNTLPPSLEHSSSAKKASAVSKESITSCVCDRELLDYEQVSCQSCHQKSHAICYGLTSNDDKTLFACHKCCEMVPEEDLQDLAMRRRAVMYLKHNNLPCARAGIALKIGETGEVTFNWLAKVKVIHIVKSNTRGRWKINQRVRDEVIQELFDQSLNFAGQESGTSRTASQLSVGDRVEEETGCKRKNDENDAKSKKRKASVVQRDLAQDWLQDCVDYCEETGDFAAEFRKQILFSDLNDYATECEHLQNQVDFVFFQIMDISEIGVSKLAIIESLAETEPKSIPRVMLKYSLMSAGMQQIDMIELDPIKELNLLTPLGTKIIVKHGSIIRGILVVKGQDVNVLGGEVDDLNPDEPRLRILNACRNNLGMEPDSAHKRLPGTVEPQIVNETNPVVVQQPPIRENYVMNPQNSESHIQHRQYLQSDQQNNYDAASKFDGTEFAKTESSIKGKATGPVDVSRLRELFAFGVERSEAPIKDEVPVFDEFDDFPIDDLDFTAIDDSIKTETRAVDGDYNENYEYPIDDLEYDVAESEYVPKVKQEFKESAAVGEGDKFDEFPMEEFEIDVAELDNAVTNNGNIMLAEYNDVDEYRPDVAVNSASYGMDFKEMPAASINLEDIEQEEISGTEIEHSFIPDSPDLAAGRSDTENEVELINLPMLTQTRQAVLASSSQIPPLVPESADMDVQIVVSSPAKRKPKPLEISSSVSPPPIKKKPKSTSTAINISSSPDLEREESLGDLIQASIIKCKDFRAIKTNKNPGIFSVKSKVYSYEKLGKYYLQRLCIMDSLGNTLDAILDPICVRELFGGISFEELQAIKASDIQKAKKLAMAYFKKLEGYDGYLTIDVFDNSVRIIAMDNFIRI